MASNVDLLVSHYSIEPAASSDLSDVQIQNSLPENDQLLLLAKISKLSKREKLQLAEKVNLAGFKKYTCVVCAKPFVQRKRDGRSRLIKHLQKSHNVSRDLVSTVKVENLGGPLQNTLNSVKWAETSETTKTPDFSSYLFSNYSKFPLLLPLTPSSLRPLDQLFEGHEVSLNNSENFINGIPTEEFIDKTSSLIAQLNVALLFFNHAMFKELAPLNLTLGQEMPHMPSVMLDKYLAVSEKMQFEFGNVENLALTVDSFDYGKLPVQCVMAYTLDAGMATKKYLVSFKAVSDDVSKKEALGEALSHWKLTNKVLSVTSGEDKGLTNEIPGNLRNLIPRHIPSFNGLAKDLIENLFEEDLSTSEILPIANPDPENGLRNLVLKLKKAINYIKADVNRERRWRSSVQENYGWLATDTDILLWNGAQWTEFCDLLARALKFIVPLNEFFKVENPKLVITETEKDELGLVLNLILPLCTWVHDFTSDSVQMHSYLIHLKKIRLLLAYMSMCDLFDSQVPGASKLFEEFMENVENDKQLFKFLLCAYLLGGCCILYEDGVFEELRKDLLEIISEENPDMGRLEAEEEVTRYFQLISSKGEIEALPEDFWLLQKGNFPNIFKIATQVLTVRPATLSFATKCGQFVLNHLRSPRHVTRSEMLLILAIAEQT